MVSQGVKKDEPKQPDLLTPSPVDCVSGPHCHPRTATQESGDEILCLMRSTSSLGDLNTNPLCDNTQISSLQILG